MASIREKGADILSIIRDEKAISDDTNGKLKQFISDFAESFS